MCPVSLFPRHYSLLTVISLTDHEFSAPFGLAAEYAHPVEVLVLGTGTIGGPLLFAILSQTIWPQVSLHIVTVYIWVILRLFQAVEAHSGYDFPWGTRHWLPFWSGAEHHDYHHVSPIVLV